MTAPPPPSLSLADMPALLSWLAQQPPGMPVLIAGPTGSGKSALALRIAEAAGGCVINADALQVYREWRILTARPGQADLGRAPHRLYGHIGRAEVYSAGHWLREVRPLLGEAERPILVGGTGLYFAILTEGLAEIPEIPAEIRARAADLSPGALRDGLDPATLTRIDQANPARLRRAWEVLHGTGRGLADWQSDTPPPALPASAPALRLAIDAPKAWLTPRLEARFSAMLDEGALDEVRANLDGFDPARPGDRAIGAPDLASYLRGDISLDAAREAALIATRQYAKRQRTWFRARMGAWSWLSLA